MDQNEMNQEQSFTLNGVDFRAEAANEESYQALRIAVELKLQEVERQKDALTSSYEAEKEAAQRQYDDLYEEANQLRIERQEFQAKWEAASNERNALLEESERDKEKIASLEQQLSDLRAQLNKPSVPTNLDNSALAEAIRKAQEAKPAIYDIQPLDNLGKQLTAKLAKTGETIEFNYLERGKYREVTAEEAEQFRNQAIAEEAAKPVVPDVSSDMVVDPGVLPVPELTFHDSSEELGDNKDADGSNVGTVQEEDPFDGESFEQEVKRRLSKLETAVFGQLKLSA